LYVEKKQLSEYPKEVKPVLYTIFSAISITLAPPS